MISTRTAAAFGVAAIVLAVFAPVASAAPGTSVSAGCLGGWADRDPSTDQTTGPAPVLSGANCLTRVVVQPGHILDLHCYAMGDGGTWSHIRDTATGAQGWIKDQYLTRGGSAYHC